jgi:hypothetical protein
MASLIERTARGEVWDMTMPEYLARTDHWSNTIIKEINRSPLHAKYAMENPKVASENMKLGTAFHVATLQPGRWDDEIIVLPLDFNAKRKADRDHRDRLQAENPHKTVITPEQEEKALVMAYNTRIHPQVKPLLKSGKPERSYFTTLYDIPVKCRVDWLPDDYKCIVELKSVVDARAGFFTHQIYNYRYFQAAAFYLRILQEVYNDDNYIDFIWIACENDGVHDVIVYGAQDETLDMGRFAFNNALEQLSECLALNQWNGYTRTARRIDLRGWMKKEEGYYD